MATQKEVMFLKTRGEESIDAFVAAINAQIKGDKKAS